MTILLIVNDPPYDTERPFNALRLALSLAKREDGTRVRLFLVGGAVACARRDQNVSPGFYSLEVMLHSLARRAVEVAVCGTCLDARGIGEDDLVPGARRSTMDELGRWVVESDRVAVF